MPTLHFFDIGANVGQTFSDYLTKDPVYDGATIHCFEPSPRHLPALMATAASLASRYKIHVYPFGLRGADGITPFYQKDDPRGDSFEHYLASDHVTTNLETGYTLHAYAAGIADFILSHTAPGDRVVLKIAAEGSEYDLLSRLIGSPEALARIDRILIETHHIKSASPVHGIRKLEALYAAVGITLEAWLF